MKKFFIIALAAAVAGALGITLTLLAHAQVATPSVATSTATSTLQQQVDSNDQQIASLNQEIAQYQAELQQVGANKATLQQAINALNLQKQEVQAQVNATQLKINTTQLQIQEMGGEINTAQQTISSDQAALGSELLILQKDEAQPLILQTLSSDNLADAWSDINGSLQVQGAIQNKMQTLQSEENELATSKAASEQKQQSLTTQQQTLTTQQQSLAQTVTQKNQLLAETNAQESTYEQLLAAAEAQLNSFTAFTQNAGGSKLLGNQTVCDSWGCYYSQRDTAWGSNSLDGTKYTLASDGCLITSLAMVLTHYGYKDVTPVTINSNPANFAAYYPAYLSVTINVDGMTVTRKTAALDATLSTGNPVIVGIRAYGGTHYVVLVSGSKGNYIMKDPYLANGDNVSFTANYSLKSIFSIEKVSIT